MAAQPILRRRNTSYWFYSNVTLRALSGTMQALEAAASLSLTFWLRASTSGQQLRHALCNQPLKVCYLPSRTR
jgi:hypothetical protein